MSKSPFQVVFTYDESTSKWEPTVHGADNATEARQGFSAVVLTIQELNPRLLRETKVTSRIDQVETLDGIEAHPVYCIHPAVTAGSPAAENSHKAS